MAVTPVLIDARPTRPPELANLWMSRQSSSASDRSKAVGRSLATVPWRGLAVDSCAVLCAVLGDSARNDETDTEYAQLLQQFKLHNDSQALITGERFLPSFREHPQWYPQAEAIVADLHRRQKSGTFGKKPRRDFPAGFEKWSVQKKVAYLIESLDEFETRDDEGLLSDRCIASLLAIGTPCVPALINAFETDKRLTRDVSFKGNIVGSSGRVLTVRDCAINAVLKILDVSILSILPEGEYYVTDTDADAKRVADHLRAYWRKSREVSFVELMLRILNDPQSSGSATREAATKLAHSVRAAGGIMVLQKSSKLTSTRSGTPTFAQVILAAMDRDLKQHLDQPEKAWERRFIEREYFDSIIELGDREITGELTRRYQAAPTTLERRLAAYAAYWLGERRPMADFARRVEAGTLILPKNDDSHLNADDQLGNVELRDIIDDLIRAGTPEADRALFAIATPRHPYCPLATSMILDQYPQETGENRVWFCHPYCLRILRREMDNKGRTDESLRIRGQQLIRVKKSSGSEESLPAFLRNSGPGWVAARRFDQAAERIADLIFGSLPYSALLDDASQRLAALKLLVDRFPGRYRRLTPLELKSLAFSQDEVLFIPDIRQLTRPATKADVAAHVAIFSLDGNRSLPNFQLPAVGIPKGHASAIDDVSRPRRFIILQAEVDSHGNPIYGVVGPGGPRMARAEEFSEIKPIPTSALPNVAGPAQAWNDLSAAMAGRDEKWIRQLTTLAGFEALKRGAGDADLMHVFERWGKSRQELATRWQPSNAADRAECLLGPVDKEQVLVFKKTAEGWKLDEWHPGM
jgi:hypothetical protein